MQPVIARVVDLYGFCATKSTQPYTLLANDKISGKKA